MRACLQSEVVILILCSRDVTVYVYGCIPRNATEQNTFCKHINCIRARVFSYGVLHIMYIKEGTDINTCRDSIRSHDSQDYFNLSRMNQNTPDIKAYMRVESYCMIYIQKGMHISIV